jgi:uncharacterized Tic20 family protein
MLSAFSNQPSATSYEPKPHNCRTAKLHNSLDYGKTEDNKYIRYFHLSVLTFIFIPLGNIIIPLILWLTKRDKIIGLNEQGADLLNFQILWTLLFSGFMVSGIIHYLDNVMDGTPPDSDSFPIRFIIGGVLIILNVIYPIIVSILSGRGSLKRYYYPLIRFVRL